jgi:hypothetical protein
MYRLNYRTMTAEIKDKPKGKSRADDTRIDVRFPLSILQAIEQIAELEGAKIHHISGKRILTPTVIELVRIGLSQVSDKYQLEISAVKSDTLLGNLSDNLTPRVEAIEGELADLKKLVDNLSVKLSDSLSETRVIELSDNVSDIIADNLPDAVADARRDNLSDDISDETTVKPITEEVLSFLAAKKAAGEMKNKDAADWLLTNGYGSYAPTTISKKIKPYLSATP